jgi:hypothetical protein
VSALEAAAPRTQFLECQRGYAYLRSMPPTPSTPGLPRDLTILDALKRTAWVFAFAVFVGLVVPGAVAWSGGVFEEEGVRERLPSSAQEKLQAYRQETDRMRNEVRELSEHIVGHALTEEPRRLQQLREIRTELATRLAASEPPVTTSGFYLGSTMHLWPVLSLCLGVLVFVLRPKAASDVFTRAERITTLYFSLAGWLIYRSPSWFRNSPWMLKEERTFYADTHWDVHWPSYVVQEANAVIIAVLLAVCWRQWILFAHGVEAQLSHAPVTWSKSDDSAAIVKLVNSIGRLYVQWQACSIVLATAFLMYTMFFWHMVIEMKDDRYLTHATIVHTMWLITWLIISTPLALCWIKWTGIRNTTIIDMPEASPGNEEIAKARKEALQAVQPVGPANLVATIVASILSFAFPLLQAHL